MRKYTKTNWNILVKDSAEVMAESISKQLPIKTLPALYEKLKEKYEKEGKALPSKNTFRQKMHKILHLPHNKRNVELDLNNLAGAYEKQTIDLLLQNVKITTSQSSKACFWIFIKISREVEDEKPTTHLRMKQKHLYHLAQKLKDAFGTSILFASFDTDTLVMLCKDEGTRARIKKYVMAAREGN